MTKSTSSVNHKPIGNYCFNLHFLMKWAEFLSLTEGRWNLETSRHSLRRAWKQGNSQQLEWFRENDPKKRKIQSNGMSKQQSNDRKEMQSNTQINESSPCMKRKEESRQNSEIFQQLTCPNWLTTDVGVTSAWINGYDVTPMSAGEMMTTFSWPAMKNGRKGTDEENEERSTK